jgi:hypothetical protein
MPFHVQLHLANAKNTAGRLRQGGLSPIGKKSLTDATRRTVMGSPALIRRREKGCSGASSGSSIGYRRKPLVEPVSMGGMKFNQVKTGFLGAICG